MTRRRRILRGAVALFGLLVLGFAAAYALSREVRYLTRAAYEETRILLARRPIAEIVAADAAPARVLRSLRLVLDARDYAATLGLDAAETYTTFADVGRDTLLLVLSAAPRDCLCPYTWTYPIVGEVPYKGYFDADMAQEAAAELAGRGYDVSLRTAGAFSTLGWFNDPLLSTVLGRGRVGLAALVFHEIAHNTLWVKDAVDFNESFAQYVGYRAAEQFFRERGDTAAARHAAAQWQDELVLSDYYEALVDRLTGFYALNLDSAAVDSGRAAIGRWAETQLEGPVAAQLRTVPIGWLKRDLINNARLIGVRLYRTRLELFDAWHRTHGGDLGRSVAALEALMEGAEGDEAFARLAEAVGRTAGRQGG